MTCLSELVCSMHADGALAPDEAAAAERHLAACPGCRAQLAALLDERQLLASALRHEPAPAAVPAFRAGPAFRAAPSRGAALAAAGLLAVLGAGPLLLAELLARLGAPQLLAWLNPVATAALVDLGIDTGIALVTQGNQLMTSIIETTGTGVVLGLLGSAAFLGLRRRGGTTAALLASAALGALVIPVPGEALEVRRSEQTVEVPAGETIDDTLIAFGNRVEVDGTITGDLVAFAQRVVVRGTVEGQVITFARTVNIDGRIGSGLIGFAQSLELGRGDVARNFFGFGQTVTTYADSRVGENAVLFGQDLELAGPIERDVLGFAEQLDLRSTVGGDLTAHGARVSLLTPAEVGGNVIAHVPAEDALEVASGASVGGTITTEIEDVEAPRNRYARLGFYFGQAVRLAAAFLAGLVLLWLAPSIRRESLDNGMGTLAAAGIGLVALVAAPIVAVIIAVTVVGLPVAVLGLMLWLVGLYFAKIVLAHFLGRRLFEATGQPKHFALALLIGLLIVIVAVNLPFVGGLVNFLLTITGLGMLVIWFWHVFDGRSPGGGRAAAPA